jgi:signal peptidase I
MSDHAARSRPDSGEDTNIIETLQSLTVAFALAMTVRAFVTEGFVIPTGSMAPTLLGAHLRYTSPATGYSYAFDAAPVVDLARRTVDGQMRDFPRPLFDPMVSTQTPIEGRSNLQLATQARMGDRVLVLKFLYPFFAPERWDVVVFKNPTDPTGDTQNYIKRMVGLPDEQLLTVDGDVFTAPLDGGLADFRIARKPEFVQRTVWQPVWDSDYAPTDPQRLAEAMRRPWEGAPFAGEGWDTEGRALTTGLATPTELKWSNAIHPINDWNAYNVYRGNLLTYPVSDVRVAAAVEADDPAALATELELAARGHLFTYAIANGELTLSLRHFEATEPSKVATFPLPLPAAGRPCELEFWHVDESMQVWLNGSRVGNLEYDWPLEDRIRYTYVGRTVEQFASNPIDTIGPPPQLSWRFRGSPLSLHRLRVDRDLHYRPTELNPGDQADTNGEYLAGFGFGSDVRKPGRLESGQYLMLGDNSAASRDGRVWGRPHPLVTRTLGLEAPFVVPKSLLLGKAWCVYFPAPLPFNGTGKALIPDFGELRFIR